MSNILLIGASGNIGGAVASSLRKKDVDFSVLVRAEDKREEWSTAGIPQIEGDVSDRASLGKAFAGFDSVFSLSPFTPDIDRTGANMVAAAKAAGIRHFVRSSALGAAPDAGMTLGRLHAAAEATLKESGLDYTILQPATFMQNYLGFADSIRSDDAFYAPMGDGRVSLIDTRDIGDVAATVLTQSGHTGKT